MLLNTCYVRRYYANFHLATFVEFFMSPRFDTCVSHSANSIANKYISYECNHLRARMVSSVHVPCPQNPNIIIKIITNASIKS